MDVTVVIIYSRIGKQSDALKNLATSQEKG